MPSDRSTPDESGASGRRPGARRPAGGSGGPRRSSASSGRGSGPERPPRHTPTVNGAAAADPTVVEELAQSNGHGTTGNGSTADHDGAEFAVVEARESVSSRTAAGATQSAAEAGTVTAPTPVVTPPGPSAPSIGDDDEDLDLDGPRRRRPGRADRRAQAPVRRGRRVRRVIRRIDLWSVLKLAIVLYTCLYGAVLATVALLWGLLYSSGQIDKLESFLADVGLENYRFYGDQMFRAVMAIGAVGVLAATLLTVITAALVNLVSEITGGIRVIVIEEDPVRPEGRDTRR